MTEEQYKEKLARAKYLMGLTFVTDEQDEELDLLADQLYHYEFIRHCDRMEKIK